MTKKRNTGFCLGAAIAIALLIGMIALTYDFIVDTQRNGEEYTDFLYAGQTFRQEIQLNHTGELAIGVLPLYQNPTKAQGIGYEVVSDVAEKSGFIPLADLPNQQWTSIRIPTEIGYNGVATVTLQGIELNEENTAQFLVVTNILQENAELTLLKDGQEIPNGRLSYSYKSWNFTGFMIWAMIGFCSSFLILFFRKKIYTAIKTYPMVFLMSVFFLVALIEHFPNLKEINLHVSAQYFFSWMDLGLVRRALAGTVIDLLNVDFDVNAYILYGIVSIALMFALELAVLYDRHHLNHRASMEKCYLLFLAMPFTASAFFNCDYFARFDQILIIFFLLSCIVVIQERGLWLIPVFSILAILVHEMYLSFFIPFVFCLLLYKWYRTKQIKYMNCLVSTSVLSLVSGGYVSFLAEAALPFEEAWARVQATGAPELIWDFPMRVEYYTPMDALRAMNYSDILRYNLIPLGGIVVLLFLPVILLVIFWLIQMWKAQSDRLGRWIVLIFPCTIGGMLISMPIMCDWGRLFILYGIGVFFTFITLWSMDSRVGEATSLVWNRVKQACGPRVFPVMCLLYFILSYSARGATTVAPISLNEAVLRFVDAVKGLH